MASLSSVIDKQFNEYRLDMSSRQAESMGESYQVEGRPGVWVMLLSDRSLKKQREIREQIQAGGSGSESPQTMVYSGSEFVGYTFNRTPRVTRSPDPDPVPQPARRKKGVMDQDAVKVIGFAVIAVLFSAAQYLVFHPLYVRTCTAILSGIQLGIMTTLSAKGITMIIAGIIGMVMAAKLSADADNAVAIILMAVGYLAGLVALDVILCILPIVITTIIDILKLLLPIAVVILVIFFLIKSKLKK